MLGSSLPYLPIILNSNKAEVSHGLRQVMNCGGDGLDGISSIFTDGNFEYCSLFVSVLFGLVPPNAPSATLAVDEGEIGRS